MPDLLNTLIDMNLDEGHMSPALNKGIVILIPKSGDKSKSNGNGCSMDHVVGKRLQNSGESEGLA